MANQIWWVDEDCNVRSGTVENTDANSVVIMSGGEFRVMSHRHIYRKYPLACEAALQKLTKIQADATNKIANLLTIMHESRG